MKNRSNCVHAPAILGICALALTVILIAARLICAFFAFDSLTSYYTGIGTFVSLYLPLICVAAVAVFCFVPRFGITQAPTLNTPTVKISAILPAAGFALYAFKCIEAYMLYHTLSNIQILALIAALFGIAFFVMTAFMSKLENAVYLVCGVLVIFWAICSIATSYFDLLTPMNSPIKIMNELGMLAFMLLVLSEMRAVFDTKRRQLQLFSVTAAVLILGVSAVPTVISYTLGRLPYTYDLIFNDVVLLGAFVFAVARLIQLCFSKHTDTTVDKDTVDEDIPKEQ